MYSKEEVIEFLISKPGYIKKGAKFLREYLKSKGFKVSLKTCKQALSEIRSRLKNKPTFKKEPKILFYDIEVSYGLAKAWRPGYKVRLTQDNFITVPKIICISYKWNNSDKVETVQWDSNQNDKLLLKQFIPELNKADFIVAHNGDKFDLPWIRTRALAHNLQMYPKYSTVDTLKISRYNHRLPSNRLDDIGEYFGLGRKIKVDFSLWDKIILEKSDKALEQMVSYCEQDVRLLEKVYNKFSTQELPKLHNGVLQGSTKNTSPFTGGTNLELIKTTTTKAGTIKRLMLCKDSDKYFEMSNQSYLKYKTLKQ